MSTAKTSGNRIRSALIFLVTLAVPLSAYAQSNTYRFGWNFLAMDGWAHAELYELGTNAGARWSREGFRWEHIETTPGIFDFDSYDDMVNIATNHPVELLSGLLYTNALYNTNGAPHSPPEYEAFARYVSNTVAHFRDRIQYWEIWNEPDCDDYWYPEPNATNYAALLQYAYQAAKAADPDCTVLGFSGDSGNLDYIGTLFTNGALTNMDIFSIHPYSQPQPFEISWQCAAIDDIRSMMQSMGSSLPIWASEVGFSSFQNVTQQRQAELLVRLHLFLFAKDVPFVMTYAAMDGSGDTNEVEAMFGMVATNLAPKKAYAAYRHMTRQIADHSFEQRLDLSYSGMAQEDVLLRFTNATQSCLAAWTFDEGLNAASNYVVTSVNRRHLKISYTGQVDTITDLYGSNSLNWQVYSNTIIGLLDNAPIYISGTLAVKDACLIETNAPVPVPLRWLDTYYPGQTNYALLAASDSDNDHMTAWEEYVAGTCPTNADSFFHLDQLTASATQSVLQWTPSTTGRLYTIQQTDQPLQTYSNIATAPYPAASWTSSLNTGTRFFRVRVEE
jgi:hypothetical protein